MAKAVKRRAYESPVRKEQAALTRRRILDAAEGLFVADGYARTTVKGIADAAGVAPDTIYATFGSKPRILTALIDLRLTSGADVANVWDRPEAQPLREEKVQRRQIELFSKDIAQVVARVRPVYDILVSAAAVDDEMRTIYEEMKEYRAANMRRVAGWIAANGPLRVDEKRAAEIIWGIVSPELNKLMIDKAGWTQDEYAEWVNDTLSRTLLPDRKRR
jgi:AcrR family transcriptional regulator